MRRKKAIIYIVLTVVIVLSACRVNDAVESTPTFTPYATPIATSTPSPVTPSPTPTATPTVEPTATPRSGPTVVGLYQSVSGGRGLLTEYEAYWNRGKDIGFFNTFASNDELLNYASYREMLVDSWFTFPNASEYKIGYQLSYVLESGEDIVVTILKPSDIVHTEYLEVYLYDSVQQYENANGGRYTHLGDETMDENTMLYSFKLTAGSKINEVESIKLMTFAYKYNEGVDFDPETGHYIGTVSYEMDIIEK